MQLKNMSLKPIIYQTSSLKKSTPVILVSSSNAITPLYKKTPLSHTMLRAMGNSLNFCRKLELEARKKIRMTLLIDHEAEAEKYLFLETQCE